jgi:hypothetical protein
LGILFGPQLVHANLRLVGLEDHRLHLIGDGVTEDAVGGEQSLAVGVARVGVGILGLGDLMRVPNEPPKQVRHGTT